MGERWRGRRIKKEKTRSYCSQLGEQWWQPELGCWHQKKKEWDRFKICSEIPKWRKNLPDNEGDVRDTGSISRSGRSPGGGHGNPLQYSYLENPRDREVWRATVHRVAKSWTQLKRFIQETLQRKNKPCWQLTCGKRNHRGWLCEFWLN